MNSKERMIKTMKLEKPDRVPVMCQLSIGHLLLNTDVTPVELWYTAEGCAQAWIQAQRRYQFDGILLNLCGPDRDIMNAIDRIEENETNQTIFWKPGIFDYTHTVCPRNDLPYNVWDEGEPIENFQNFDPEKDLPSRLEWMPVSQSMHYEIHPESCFDTLHHVQQITGDKLSLHGEVFSPWDYHLATFGAENALMAIMDDPGKVHAILAHYTELIANWAVAQVREGVNTITLSSPWAGQGFISRKQYETFILPYERKINTAIREAGAFCCTHTCGSLGDRLDLLVASNTCGIECLDPPPLGNVELVKAKEITRGKVFIKGNLDSVNVLLKGNTQKVKDAARSCLDDAMEDGGYILSTACSVAPGVPPENLNVLFDIVEKYGRY